MMELADTYPLLHQALMEVGQNHYYRGKDLDGWGDHVYWQGHASPEFIPEHGWKVV